MSVVAPPGLAEILNGLPTHSLERTLRACCGSTAWVRGVMAGVPFASDETVVELARRVWARLREEDRLEAFAAHPRIGAMALAERWSRAEQSGVEGASPEVLDAIARGNRAYERRFGFRFLICATGLTAARMREALEERLTNDRAVELETASDEQEKITELRLARVAAEAGAGG